MKKRLLFIGLLVLTAMCFTVPVLAQGAEPKAEAAAGTWYKYLPGFAMAIASTICALGQSKAVVAACESVSRNPGAAESIRFFLILGLVLIESLALYTLLIILIK